MYFLLLPSSVCVVVVVLVMANGHNTDCFCLPVTKICICSLAITTCMYYRKSSEYMVSKYTVLDDARFGIYPQLHELHGTNILILTLS